MRSLPTLILAVALGGWTAAAAQPAQGGELAGRVVDGGTGGPLGHVRVTLMIRPRGVVLSERDGSTRLAAGRTYHTSPDGRYRFRGLGAGRYRLFVQRIGYRPTTIEIDLEGGQGLSLSVGLTVAPIRLEPVDAVTVPADLLRINPRRDAAGWDRTALERWRQATFLESDVRLLASPDLTEAVTLGEMDVLRALQRLPGVTARDDWTAEPWIRGAHAGQTRLYFDGLPLFNPVHAGGVLTAINADALGGVFLYSGARPPQFSDGAGAVVDLRSRAAHAGGVSGAVTASNASASMEVERRWLDGRVGTVLAVRRSWLQRTRRLVPSTRGVSPEIPNDYADGVARVDVLLDATKVLETSGTWQRDWIDGYLPGGTANNRSSWGTVAARSTLQFPLGSGTARQTVGFSFFNSRIRQIESRTPLAAFDPEPTQETTDNSLTYVTVNGMWAQPTGDGRGARWKAGYDVAAHLLRYRGAPPTPYSMLTYLYTAELEEDLTTASAWAERWWHPSDDIELRIGLRASVVAGRGDPTVSPHFSLRYRFADDAAFSAASGSHHQWIQALAPSGVGFGPGLGISPIWVAPADSGDVLRTEIRTFGFEHWLSPDWLGSVTYYQRRTTAMVIPDPRPGTTDDDAFLVPARNAADGVEVHVQRLAGSWTGSLAYALGVSTYAAADLEYPAPSDRRHVLTAVGSGRVPRSLIGGGLRVGGAVSVASGAPYTRIHPGAYDCHDYQPGGHCTAIVPNLVELPNAQRAPASTGFNVMFDWSRSFSRWRITTHFEIQNLLNAPRSGTYAVDGRCRRSSRNMDFCGVAEDGFIPGLSRHYELGVRVAF